MYFSHRGFLQKLDLLLLLVLQRLLEKRKVVLGVRLYVVSEDEPSPGPLQEIVGHIVHESCGRRTPRQRERATPRRARRSIVGLIRASPTSVWQHQGRLCIGVELFFSRSTWVLLIHSMKATFS